VSLFMAALPLLRFLLDSVVADDRLPLWGRSISSSSRFLLLLFFSNGLVLSAGHRWMNTDVDAFGFAGHCLALADGDPIITTEFS
jgi:hypothetical protein